jgi:hypothetical protein
MIAIVSAIIVSAIASWQVIQGSAWWRFGTATREVGRMALLPIDLMTFFDDLHTLQILRLSDGRYEFRSLVIQEGLADSAAAGQQIRKKLRRTFLTANSTFYDRKFQRADRFVEHIEG